MNKSFSFHETIGLLNQICFYDEKIYRWWNMLDVYTCLIPPVSLGQFRIWFDEEDDPIGFMTWAFMSKEVEDYFLKYDEMPEDIEAWKSGDRLWGMDFVAPFGGANHYVRDVWKTVLNDYAYARIIRRTEDNTIRRYGKFFNPYYQK